VIPMDRPTRLAIAWNQEVPVALYKQMERHARRLGLPMDTIEVLGLDSAVCSEFVKHAEAGAADLFLAELDVDEVRAASQRRAPLLTVFDDAAFVY